MLDTLKRGEVLLGDALYATYFLLADLHERGVDAVFEQHRARGKSTNFKHGLSVGVRDYLLILSKPKLKPEWMTQEQYNLAPDTVMARGQSFANCVPVERLSLQRCRVPNRRLKTR